VSELCGVKPYVLRYWEQEFTQLRPMKRRGNRRYYQHHEVLLIRRIRDLLYDQGFTISGARNRLLDAMPPAAASGDGDGDEDGDDMPPFDPVPTHGASPSASVRAPQTLEAGQLRAELLSIRELLSV
jgi:DNA-binding transcriptional MerR regulator